MKKNLTLLMMLVAFVGILSAQSGPKFNYQAVVRNADTLVYNQEMTVTIDVTDGTNCYSETHTATTTRNGLVSVIVGEGTPVDCGGSLGNIARIDWSKATITATFAYDAVTLTSTAPVVPVPYALQAGTAPLTTEMIANYMKNTLTTQDAKDILNALVLYNDPLQQDLEDTIEVYMKAHKDIAVDVAKSYLEHLNAGHVQEFFNALDANAEGKDAVKDAIKDFIIMNRELAKELTIWYLRQATPYDIQRAYATMQDIPVATQQAVKDRLIAYLQTNRTLLYEFGIYLMDNVTSEEAHNAYSYFKLANPYDVKGQMRDTLNHYIDMYLAAHSGYGDVTSTTVDNAINNYLASHHLVQKCTSVPDLCEIQQLYNLLPPPCPSFYNTAHYEVSTGYSLQTSMDYDLTDASISKKFHVTVYSSISGESNLDISATGASNGMSAILTWGQFDDGGVTKIEYYPVVELSCGDGGTHTIEGETKTINH